MISTSDLVKKIEAESPRVTLSCAPLGINTERLVVEGDIGLSSRRVLPYAARRIEIALQAKPDAPDRQGLLGIERDGKILRWRRGKTLRYCVWRPTFGSDAEYAAALEAMAVATSDWAGICGVSFDHDGSKDHDADFKFGDVDFPVMRQAGGGSVVALAFFPDDPVKERVVWTFDGFFSSAPGAFDPVGVLRHELGHVLGFRHEHIRPEAPALFNPESTEHTVAISDYDPQSVMHYVGPGVGDSKFRFTPLDKQGARSVYGGPDTEFSFAD